MRDFLMVGSKRKRRWPPYYRDGLSPRMQRALREACLNDQVSPRGAGAVRSYCALVDRGFVKMVSKNVFEITSLGRIKLDSILGQSTTTEK